MSRKLLTLLSGVEVIPSFVSTWKTDNAGVSNNDQIKLPLDAGGTYNFKVDYGDGTPKETITAFDQAETTHTYASSGTFDVTITGICTGWGFAGGGDRLKFLNIAGFGPLRLGGIINNFFGCTNLTITATDVLDLTGQTSLDRLFRDCSSLTTIPSLNNWDMSLIESILEMFQNCTLFNSPVGAWNTQNIANMIATFLGCPNFNQPIGNWDLSSCLNLGGFLNGASAFDQVIGTWNTPLLINVSSMLKNASSFNQTLETLDFSSVGSMSEFLRGASSYNKPLEGLDTSGVVDMSRMLQSATSYNQPLEALDTNMVLDMSNMLRGATSYNQPLESLPTGAVTTMVAMLRAASSYNKPLGSLSTGSVVNMGSMLRDATAFDQDIGNLDITAVTNAANMLLNVTLSTSNYNSTLIGFEAQAVQNNVTFSGGNSTFNSGAPATARAALIADHTWTITDGCQV